MKKNEVKCIQSHYCSNNITCFPGNLQEIIIIHMILQHETQNKI